MNILQFSREDCEGTLDIGFELGESQIGHCSTSKRRGHRSHRRCCSRFAGQERARRAGPRRGHQEGTEARPRRHRGLHRRSRGAITQLQSLSDINRFVWDYWRIVSQNTVTLSQWTMDLMDIER